MYREPGSPASSPSGLSGLSLPVSDSPEVAVEFPSRPVHSLEEALLLSREVGESFGAHLGDRGLHLSVFQLSEVVSSFWAGLRAGAGLPGPGSPGWGAWLDVKISLWCPC